jgi:hypothetical protein
MSYTPQVIVRGSQVEGVCVIEPNITKHQNFVNGVNAINKFPNPLILEKSIHTCEISDSFVHQNLKLSGGKCGNGESRLFISNNREFTEKLINKPWKIYVDHNYKKDIKHDLEINQFKKSIENRVKQTSSNIDKLNGQIINVQLQPGNKDVNRNYIGQTPHRIVIKKKDRTKEEQTNIDKWDLLRQCLMPTKTTLEFYDNDDNILVNIVHNNNVHRYNKIHGCSFVQLEFIKKIEQSQNIEIQSAKNKGEFKLRNPENGYMWPVDGYHNCDHHRCNGSKDNLCIWHKTVFEFQGDYWHKNKKDKDIKKKLFYESEGYKWFEIAESEWTLRKKVIKSLVRH